MNGGGVQNDNDKEKAVKEERGEEATQRNGRAEGPRAGGWLTGVKNKLCASNWVGRETHSGGLNCLQSRYENTIFSTIHMGPIPAPARSTFPIDTPNHEHGHYDDDEDIDEEAPTGDTDITAA